MPPPAGIRRMTAPSLLLSVTWVALASTQPASDNFTVQEFPSFHPVSMCMASAYLVSYVGNESDPVPQTNMCKCWACAGGGPGKTCCCDRPGASQTWISGWICEWVDQTAGDRTNHSLQKLLTCPLCRPPNGSLTGTELRCCDGSLGEEVVEEVATAGPVVSDGRLEMPAMFPIVLISIATLVATISLAAAVLRCSRPPLHCALAVPGAGGVRGGGPDEDGRRLLPEDTTEKPDV